MQIFILDNDRQTSKFLDDKRLPKMVLETAQILCSALKPEDSPYKITHYNHPCCKWVRESESNYIWLLN